jgi:outer membrane protein assembly factor BamD (BamD/ComL family)
MNPLYRTSTKITLFTAYLIALMSMQCSSSAPVVRPGFEMRQVAEADSLFRTGNYELAKLKFAKLRDAYTNPIVDAHAQYYLGYINIYYENPFADYDAALREFRIFASEFPNDERIELVNNWIRMLTAMQNYDTHFHNKVDKLKEVESKQVDISKNYSTLQDAYLNCEALRDSLVSRIRILDGVIEKLGKIETPVRR